MIKVSLIPVLEDNYTYLIESPNLCGLVDPGDSRPVEQILDERGLIPDVIFNTHHHGDHTAGNSKLKQKYNCKIVGPKKDEKRIPHMDEGLQDGDVFEFDDEPVRIIETPGHTAHHICFYFENSRILFSGDTLFSLGCGRLFEGEPEDMWNSLMKLSALPDETKIYCGHEYTLANGEFCLSIEPDNSDLQKRMEEVQKLRTAGRPTLPVTLALEKKTNVFLRAKDVHDFTILRAQKDSF